jgi:hypothetical protein
MHTQMTPLDACSSRKLVRLRWSECLRHGESQMQNPEASFCIGVKW